MQDLFTIDGEKIALGPGAVLLRRRALAMDATLVAAIQGIARAAPFRCMTTPGGFEMSVAMTNCGSVGWVTDRSGYRYVRHDPLTGLPWPALPDFFVDMARDAADEAGFTGFTPDACLINRYEPGARLSLHQDKDERDFGHPVVSVSLGLPAVFQFGGHKRGDRPRRVPLGHADIVVWGGPSRLIYHGVLALKDGDHPAVGRCRYNLTLRKAL